jgi:hypothetical protein
MIATADPVVSITQELCRPCADRVGAGVLISDWHNDASYLGVARHSTVITFTFCFLSFGLCSFVAKSLNSKTRSRPRSGQHTNHRASGNYAIATLFDAADHFVLPLTLRSRMP